MELISIVLVVLLTAAIAGLAYFYKKLQAKPKEVVVQQQQNLTELEAIEKASTMAKDTLIEAEKKAAEVIRIAQESAESTRLKLLAQEKNLDERETKIIQRSDQIERRFDEMDRKDKAIETARLEVKAIKDQLSTELEKVANLSRDEAIAQLKSEVEKDLNNWTAKRIKESEQKVKMDSDEISRDILVETMLNSSVDYVAETTTTTIEIEDESMKSRIIGKAGRNIRTLERLTGVDVIIDESPNEVTISCFDPIRREVGAIVLQKLLKSGKINPATIEETIDKVKKDVLKEIKKTGDEIAFETGFNDLPNEIIMLLGRFKYRFSYGQNLVKHTLEMVKIGEYLANELGADTRITKLACLLHDIGKVMPGEGKQHHHMSAELAEKYYKDERLVNAIAAHHFDIDAKYIEAEIVRIADSISGARPGARRDTYEEYVKRVRALEDIANKHTGVKESFAIQAGREVRVIVKPEEISDEDAKVMAFKIAKEIENTQNYPGVVKVNVIREFRVVEEAK